MRMTMRGWIWIVLLSVISCSDGAKEPDAAVAGDASVDLPVDTMVPALDVVPDVEHLPLDTSVDGVADGTVDTVFSHPSGWIAGQIHGAAFMADTASCSSCHGQDLRGGSALSCEGCHSGWQTNCVFCHGGLNDQTGAPPHDLSGNTLATVQSVGQHSEHVVTTDLHQAFDCDTCHTKPTSALSSGHIGPSPAEVTFSGIAAGGSYDPQNGQCTVYCHGNGTAATTAVSWTTSLPAGDCSGCHDDETDGASINLSGKHKFHVVSKSYGCYQCHFCVVNNNKVVVSPDLHVNGKTDVCGAANWNATSKSCTPYCHGVKSWY